MINTFLNTRRNKKVWIRSPPGFKTDGMVLLLQCALYSLRVSLLLRHEILCDTMQKLCLKPVLEYIYLFSNSQLIVFFYVNNIIAVFYPTSG